jgi:NosR/NirI family nitrous oxide reductase transcriptional regulator
MRNVCLVLVMALLALSVALAQTPLDPTLEARLKKAFPAATSFSTKQTSPVPHFIAYTGNASARTVAGYVYWTTELDPLERGYDGPIKMLVGMDLKGILTGVLVTDHKEPYGYFSVELPEFSRQFAGKNIRDAFKVGVDVHAVSRATITITSSSRAIRNSSLRIARALIAPPAAK